MQLQPGDKVAHVGINWPDVTVSDVAPLILAQVELQAASEIFC